MPMHLYFTLCYTHSELLRIHGASKTCDRCVQGTSCTFTVVTVPRGVAES